MIGKMFYFKFFPALVLSEICEMSAEERGRYLSKMCGDLVRGASDNMFIQGMIDEANNYSNIKRSAGKKGGEAKASKALAKASSAIAEPSTPLASNSSTSSTPPKPKPKSKELKTIAPDGVTEKTWCDFKTLRTKRRAPITDTVMDGITSEAEKAGITLEEALKVCCVKAWQSFDSTWYQNLRPQDKKTAPQDTDHRRYL